MLAAAAEEVVRKMVLDMRMMQGIETEEEKEVTHQDDLQVKFVF